MALPYQVSDWYGGCHTCRTASGATVYVEHFTVNLVFPLKFTGKCWTLRSSNGSNNCLMQLLTMF